MGMNEDAKARFLDLLDKLEIAAMEYEHGATDDRAAIDYARLDIVAFVESLLPHEEEDTAHEPMSTEPPEDPNRWEDVWFWRNKARGR